MVGQQIYLRLNKHIDDIKAKDINYKQFFP
jgi:hypothetical protein